MGKITTPAMAGSIVRRIRKERGMSRAELSQATGIGTRTLYALETGESPNFGLANYLKVLDALGLALSVDLDAPAQPSSAQPRNERPPWDDLGDLWRLDDASGR